MCLQVRTIFVSGFPADTKERELQNLLRWWPGYEACQLTIKADAPLGFALFSTPAMAIAARDALQVRQQRTRVSKGTCPWRLFAAALVAPCNCTTPVQFFLTCGLYEHRKPPFVLGTAERKAASQSP